MTDPNVTGPDNPAAPAAPAEPTTYEVPPPDYEPQTELSPDQNPGISERGGTTVSDVEEELPNVGDDPEDGAAADGDDSAEEED